METQIEKTQQKIKVLITSKNKIILLLLALSLSCSGLLLLRIYMTQELYYLFLLGNLLLAMIPLAIAYYLHANHQRSISFLIISVMLWILFLPNAPYIITDFIHLDPYAAVPMWFDAILIFSFATTGLLSGLISLHFVHEVLDKYLSPVMGWLMIGFVSLLTGYGIFIGRFLRWHSKDLFFHPKPLLTDVVLHLKDTRAIAMTSMFALLLVFCYLILQSMIGIKNDKQPL